MSNSSSPVNTDADANDKDYSRALFVAVFVSIEVVAVVGNVFFVHWSCCRTRRKQTRTSVYMVFVCVTHLGVAVFVIPFIVVSLSAKRWILGTEVCYFNGLMVVFWFTVCVYSMTVLSLHKYCSIVYPFFRPHAHRTVATLILASVGVSVVVSGATVVYSGVSYEPAVWVCTVFADRSEKKFVSISVVMCFGYLLPVLVNVVAYWRTVVALRAHASRLEDSAAVNRKLIESQKHITHTLFATFAMYMSTWTPFFVSWLYYIVRPGAPALTHLRRTAFVIGTLSTALSPVIYITRNPDILKVFVSAFKRGSRYRSSVRGADTWPSSPHLYRMYQPGGDVLRVQTEFDKLDVIRQSDV